MAILNFKDYFWSVLLVAVLVEATPPEGHVATPDNDQHPPKYEYGYIVSDHEGSQGHMESRDGIYALGRYHVTLPDGSAQKVTYFADDWGYHPLVSYGSSTEHGASSTHFAMGDQAVAALKQTNSPAANLISAPAPTQPITTITSNAEQLVGVPKDVQISNAGASGHHDQSYQSQVSTISTTTVAPTGEVTQPTPEVTPHVTEVSTAQSFISTSAPVTVSPPVQELQQTVSVLHNAKEIASLEDQRQIAEKIQNQIEQHQDVQAIQNELSEHIQQTINKLEQESNQKLEQAKQQVLNENSLFIPEQAAQQIQFIQDSFQQSQQNIENEVREQQQTQQKFVTVSEPSLQHSSPDNQNYAQTISPAHQFISSQAQQIISISPTQQLITTNQQTHSPLSSLLLHESPTAGSTFDKVEIVTPTPIAYPKPVQSYPVLASNSLASKNSEEESFNIEGQNIQITSYLADTNKVLRFGDRIQSKDRQAEQRIIDQVEKHAKLRILEDLQKNSALNSFTRPIVVTGSPSHTTEISIVTPRPTSNEGANTAIYSSGYNIVNTFSQSSPSPTAAPLTANGYLESNSIAQNAVEKSDFTLTQFLNGYSHQSHPFVQDERLSSLHPGYPVFTATEKPSAPVNEENKEGVKTIVDVQKGIAYDIPEPNQPEVGQYQALGYERRLVDQRAQQVVNEKDPALQELKAQDLAVRQEIELQQVQQNLQALQNKIVNEIDAHHEEEQRKQEAVANERQKHLDNLQKVADLLQSIPQDHQSYAPQPNLQIYQAPQYLPPAPTAPAPTRQTTYQNYDSPINYHGVTISSHGQDIQAYTHNVKVESSNYESSATPSVVEIEKPVYIEKPVEVTKVVEVERPVIVKEPEVVQVEKNIPVLQPYPVTITKVVTVDRPVAVPTPYGVPQPVPFPYAVPHAIGVPIPHLVPYPELYPVAFKQYHPVFIQAKSSHDMKPSKRMPEQVFREPKPELYQHSKIYHTIPLHMKSSSHTYPIHKSSYYRHYTKSHPVYSGRNRNSLKNLRIEYGGFKPPLIPSTEFSEDPKPSPYGPSVKEQ